MIGTKPYEFMIKYTPQRDWIEGHGILIAFALFFGGIAGGLYLVSLYFDSLLGMFIAWLLAMVTGLTDMAHLTKRARFWRMLLKPKTSWISRGFIVIWLFLGAAAIQLAISFWADGGAAETFFKVVGGIGAFGVAVYSGFVVGYVGAIKLWNSAIIPILFVVAGVTGGLALLMVVSVGETFLSWDVAIALRWVLIAYAVCMAIYLWVATYESTAARDAAMRILRGNIASVFWPLVVLLGIIVPIIMLFASDSTAVFVISGIFIIIGGVALRYCILKAGVYSPLVPTE
ncbi:MAG TPA: polysulfide reductase NrfD [Dehalococcoidia bacterium]|nr:polysulfide reductase NrfD [Dehalococcoidia bacterium]